MVDATPDPGVLCLKQFEVGPKRITWANLFAVNDTQSMVSVMERALQDETGLAPLRHPSPRLWFGLILVALGLLLGWPAVALLGLLALWFGKPWILAVGGPVVYGISWVVYLAGFAVGGPAAVNTLRALNRWLARSITLRLLGPEGAPEPGTRQAPKTSTDPPGRP